MNRRELLALTGTTGVATLAGWSLFRPTERVRGTVDTTTEDGVILNWSIDGRHLAALGTGGHVVRDGLISAGGMVSHEEGTRLRSIELRLWAPGVERANQPELYFEGPFQGNLDTEPPDVSLFRTFDEPGMRIEMDDFDDLAGQTVSFGVHVHPDDAVPTTLAFEVAIELTGIGILKPDARLTGSSEIDVTGLDDESD